MLGIITVPFEFVGAVVTGIFNVFESVFSNDITGAAEDAVTGAADAMDVFGASTPIVSAVIDIKDIGDTINDFEGAAQSIVQSRIRQQVRWLNYYWTVFKEDLAFPPGSVR